jgi:hypothetical protein
VDARHVQRVDVERPSPAARPEVAYTTEPSGNVMNPAKPEDVCSSVADASTLSGTFR